MHSVPEKRYIESNLSDSLTYALTHNKDLQNYFPQLKNDITLKKCGPSIS